MQTYSRGSPTTRYGEGAGGERGGVVAVNQLYIVGLGKVNGEGMQ